MDLRTYMVATSIGDLAACPEGTRIATSHDKLLICGIFAGAKHWYEKGELINYQPLVSWLPAVILSSDLNQRTKKEAKK